MLSGRTISTYARSTYAALTSAVVATVALGLLALSACTAGDEATVPTIGLTTTSIEVTTTATPSSTLPTSPPTTEDPRIADVLAAYSGYVGIFDGSTRGTAAGDALIARYAEGELETRILESTAKRIAEGQTLVGSYESEVVAVTITDTNTAVVLDCGLDAGEWIAADGSVVVEADQMRRLTEVTLRRTGEEWAVVQDRYPTEGIGECDS